MEMENITTMEILQQRRFQIEMQSTNLCIPLKIQRDCILPLSIDVFLDCMHQYS